MNTSQIKSQTASLLSQLKSQKAATSAARAQMLSTSGLDHAIASARYATLAFDAGKLAKRYSMHAGAVAALEQADAYSAQGRRDESFGALVVAATMLGMSGTVKKLSMSGPRFISAAMIQKAATPVSSSGSSFVTQNALTQTEVATKAASVFGSFEEFPGYGSFGEGPDVQGTDEGVELNSQAQENAGFSDTPDPSGEVPDGKLTTADGKSSADLNSGAVKQGMEDVQTGASKVKTGIAQIDYYSQSGDAIVGDLKSLKSEAQQGDVVGLAVTGAKTYAQGAAVVGAASVAGSGLAAVLVSAGVLSAAVPAGTIIAGVIVLAVGIYCLVELLSDDDPPAPTIAQTQKVPRWLTNGDPNIAATLLGKKKANVKADGPVKVPAALQAAVLLKALPAGHPAATPPKVSTPGGSSGLGLAAAGAGAGFLVGNVPGAVVGGVVGWLMGKK